MPKLIDRTGQVYGRLKVLRRFECGPASKGKRTKWVCACECGTETSVTGHELAAGDTTSCGCFHKETIGRIRRTHGMTRSGAYRSWQAAKDRCHNPNNQKYASYGGAGIVMCELWRDSFQAFYAEMGERPKDMTIDRLDQTKGYEPGNCQWATAAEQSLTRGTTKLYRWRGGWMTTRQIADREGIYFNTLRKLVRNMTTIQAAVVAARERKRNFRVAA